MLIKEKWKNRRYWGIVLTVERAVEIAERGEGRELGAIERVFTILALTCVTTSSR